MNIVVINGPNLNMLGIREPALYGSGTYADLSHKIGAYCAEKGIAVDFYQSNHGFFIIRTFLRFIYQVVIRLERNLRLFIIASNSCKINYYMIMSERR